MTLPFMMVRRNETIYFRLLGTYRRYLLQECAGHSRDRESREKEILIDSKNWREIIRNLKSPPQQNPKLHHPSSIRSHTPPRPAASLDILSAAPPSCRHANLRRCHANSIPSLLPHAYPHHACHRWSSLFSASLLPSGFARCSRLVRLCVQGEN